MRLYSWFPLAMLAVYASGCNPMNEDKIVCADLFSPQAEILSAGFGFDGIIGLDGDEKEVRAGGGTWNKVTCTHGDTPERRVHTSAVAYNDALTKRCIDAIPVVFSWPYLPSTLAGTDFVVRLNDGTTVTPVFAAFQPNFEYNERQTAVIFGEFGNRQRPDETDSIHPVRVEVVKDDNPLMLVGPNGLVSAVGLGKDSTNPYVVGPGLVAAKLNRFFTDGEGGPSSIDGPFPNDGVALYGSKAKFRLRTYTSGGFSPDGVRGLRPNEYQRFFRLHAKGSDGSDVLIETVDVDHNVAGGVIRVIGLADLGLAASSDVHYDDCYLDDWDNYIDIVLDGDEAAMRSIVSVEIPAMGNYSPFFNPGGPGNDPTPGVRYTQPGAPQVQPVTMALDDPMIVSYED